MQLGALQARYEALHLTSTALENENDALISQATEKYHRLHQETLGAQHAYAKLLEEHKLAQAKRAQVGLESIG